MLLYIVQYTLKFIISCCLPYGIQSINFTTIIDQYLTVCPISTLRSDLNTGISFLHSVCLGLWESMVKVLGASLG